MTYQYNYIYTVTNLVNNDFDGLEVLAQYKTRNDAVTYADTLNKLGYSVAVEAQIVECIVINNTVYYPSHIK